MDTYLDTPMINSKQPLLVLSTRDNTKEPSFRDSLSNPETKQQIQRILHQLDEFMRMSRVIVAIVDSYMRMQLEPLERFSNWFDDFCEGRNEQAKNDFGFAYEILCLMIKEIDMEGEECRMNELGRESYSAILKGLYKYLAQYPDVYIYKGWFPKTADSIKDKAFSFVHLDVDIYESVLNCLKFFYPRMSKGAMLLSHDMGSTGPQKAFREFFEDKPEPIIELSHSQWLITKVS